MTHEPTSTAFHYGGTQREFDFPNGFTASVVCHNFSYGNESGLFELAVKHGGHLVYDTPITDDVIGYLTEPEVQSLLDAIATLPPR